MKLGQSIELHCKDHPFTVESLLTSVVSSALVPETAKEDILFFDAEKGQKRFEGFVKDSRTVAILQALIMGRYEKADTEDLLKLDGEN